MIKKKLINYNINIISIKTSLFIKIINLKDYKEVNFYIYQRFIKKLIYFSYSIRLDIAFIVKKLNRYNTNLKKSYF